MLEAYIFCDHNSYDILILQKRKLKFTWTIYKCLGNVGEPIRLLQQPKAIDIETCYNPKPRERGRSSVPKRHSNRAVASSRVIQPTTANWQGGTMRINIWTPSAPAYTSHWPNPSRSWMSRDFISKIMSQPPQAQSRAAKRRTNRERKTRYPEACKSSKW